MEERAREALVAAALAGRPQITGLFHSPKGDCAIGILHDLVEGHKREACASLDVPLDELSLTMGLGQYNRTCLVEGCNHFFSYETALIAHLNDSHGWDFLTIARKMP